MIFVCKKCCSSPSVRQRDLALTHLTQPVGVGVGVGVDGGEQGGDEVPHLEAPPGHAQHLAHRPTAGDFE